MRAAVLDAPGGPDAVRVRDVEPPTPGPGEVLVRVAACGVCGHDQADRSGLTATPLPTVLGHEIAGTVVGRGPGVRHLDTGDRVAVKQFSHCGRCRDCLAGRDVDCPRRQFTYGGWAELAVVPESSTLPVPETVTLIDAAVAACAVGTCVQALDAVADLRPGETAVVTGAGGGLGVHGAQVARTRGAVVVAVTGTAAKAAAVAPFADHVVVAAGDWWPELFGLTDGRGADVVLDTVGHPAVFRQAFRALAQRGRYVFVGQVTGEPIRLHPAFVFGKEARITGSASTTMGSFVDALDLIADGSVTPVLTRYPLDDVVRACADLDARAVSGRIVLVPEGDR